MNKKLLTAAVSAALAAPAAMAGDVTMYGQVHIATSSYDADIDSGDAWDISSHATRLGFKGSEDLGGSLKAIWQIELGISASDNADDADGGNTVNNADGLSYRNTFVGLSGNWGTALIGRHDTPLKISTGALDLFSDTIADYNNNGADDEPIGAGNLTAFVPTDTVSEWAAIPLLAGQSLGFVDLRVDQAIAYISPNFNGLTLAGAIVQPGMDRADTHTSGMYADSADGFAEAYSVAAMYSNGPFYASLAWEYLSEDLMEELMRASPGAPFDDNDGQGYTDNEHRWRVGLGYTANGMHVGFVYENQEHAVVGVDAQRWQLSGSYNFGNNVLKAMYGENEVDVSSNGADALDDGDVYLMDGSSLDSDDYRGFDVRQWAIGLDHNFSKRTKAYIVYTDVDVDHNAGTDTDVDNDGSWDGISIGLVHKF
jgi:predicted porin